MASGAHEASPESLPEPTLFRLLDAEGVLVPGAPEPLLDVPRRVALYEAMVRARLLDSAIERMQRQGRIGFHVSSAGEEAAVLGSAAALANEDWIFPCYREWAALLWRGLPLVRFLDGGFANADDPTKGRQMPAHVTGRTQRYGSVSSPIGTQIPHAVGFAKAIALRGDAEVAAVYFGDGATSSNDFHSGMTFASVWKAPVLLICRNNGYAISLPTREQSASRTIAEKAIAYGMRGVRCDGNDLLAVHRVVHEARARALTGEGPTLVELVTYRLSGHSTSDDPRIYRSEEELEAKRRDDPIPRVRKHLEGLGAWDEAREQALRSRAEAEIKDAVTEAEAVKPPALRTLFEDVFAEMPESLRRDADALEAGPRAAGGK